MIETWDLFRDYCILQQSIKMVHLDLRVGWILILYLLEMFKFCSITHLIMKFFLEGWGKVCGHLPNGIAGGITDPWVLNMRNTTSIFFIEI